MKDKHTHALIALLAALLCSVAARAQETELQRHFDYDAKLTKQYDRFQDKTFIHLSPMLVSGEKNEGLYIVASTAVIGEHPKEKADAFVLGVMMVSHQPHVADDATLYAIIEGERVNLGEMNLLQKDWDGSLHSTNYVLLMKRDAFSKIAFAKSVEMRFNGTEFKLTERQRHGLMDILNYSEPNAF